MQSQHQRETTRNLDGAISMSSPVAGNAGDCCTNRTGRLLDTGITSGTTWGVWCSSTGASRSDFTLKEVGQLLRPHEAVAGSPARRGAGKVGELNSIVRLGQEKLQSIEEKVESLQWMKKQLRSVILDLKSRRGSVCPASKTGPRVHSA